MNFVFGSLGESVSGLIAYVNAGQISEEDYKQLDDIAFKLENGLIKLVESLETKRDNRDWTSDMKMT